MQSSSSVLAGILALASMSLGCSGGAGAGQAQAEEPEPSVDTGEFEERHPLADPDSDSERAPATTEADEQRIAAIQKAVNDTQAARHECWAFAAADGLRVSGDIILSLTFGNGETAGVAVASDSTEDERLVRCIQELYEAYRWPPVFAPGVVVSLPLSFTAPRSQYTVFAKHVEARDLAGGAMTAAVVLDEENSGNGAASITLLVLKAGHEIPLHRERSTELLYVKSGRGILLGLGGKKQGTPIGPGQAVYIPPGTAHGIVQTGSEPLALVQIYAPAGPEQQSKGGPILGTAPVSEAERKQPPRTFPKPLVSKTPARYALADGKAEIAIHFEEAKTGDKVASLGVLTAQPGAQVPMHAHGNESEILFILSGEGTMTVNGDPYAIIPMTAVQLPPGAVHGVVVQGAEPLVAVQVYTPSGPEQRFKKAP